MLKWSVPRRVDLRIRNELFKTSGPVVSSSDRFALFTAGVVSSHEHHRQRVGRSLIRATEYTYMVVRRSLPRQDLEGLGDLNTFPPFTDGAEESSPTQRLIPLDLQSSKRTG